MSVLTATEKRSLDEIFYGGGVLMRKFDQFKDKSKSLNLSDDKLRYYYDNQELVQLFKPSDKPKTYIPITATYPMERLYFDTMVITPLNLTLINSVDLFSKYGFVKVFRGLSTDSVKASKALEDIVRNGYYPTSIRTDDGTEFYGSFKKNCDELGIQLVHLEPGDKKKTSPIEAFNRTIRLAIEKVRATLSSGNPVQAQVEKAIKEIVANYNQSIHSSINAKPSDVIHNKDTANEVLVKTVLKKKAKLDELSGGQLAKGASVRLVEKSGIFSKLSPNWTKDLFKVREFDEGKNRYLIEGKRRGYERWEIQPVDEKTLMRKTISRWVVKGARDDDKLKSRSQRKAEKELATGVWFGDTEGKRSSKKKQLMDL